MTKADEDVAYGFGSPGGFVRTDRRASVMVKNQKTRAEKRGQGFQYQTGVSLSRFLLLESSLSGANRPPRPRRPVRCLIIFAFSLPRSQLDSVHQSTSNLQA